MLTLWEPRGVGLPHQHADFHSIPIFTTTWYLNPDPLAFKLLHKVKPDLLLVWPKGSRGLMVFVNFLPTLPSSATSNPCPFKGACPYVSVSLLLAGCPPTQAFSASYWKTGSTKTRE